LPKRRPQKEIVNSKINRTNSDSILETLTAARAPLTPADLAERLRLGPDDHGVFNQEIEELERAGRIVRNRAGLLLVATRANLLSGQVQGHRDGFGFLIRDDGGADLVLSEHEMTSALRTIFWFRPAHRCRQNRGRWSSSKSCSSRSATCSRSAA
jgi:hypothetical protein